MNRTEFWLNHRHGYDVREARHANEAQYAAIPLLTATARAFAVAR